MAEKSYKTFFKGKKITMLGLGLLGRGVNVAKFLAGLGAELTITDLKTAEALESSLKQLKKFSNIRYVLGEHKLEDFRNRDIVIKSAGVPFDSIYVAEARAHNIPVEMDASLFAKFSPARIIGVTGTRGKSTVTHLVEHILKGAYPGRVFVGGNVRGMATLPLLKKVKLDDFAVFELDSWQLQGFGDAKISPEVAVFTNFLSDHMNYYRGDMEMYFNDKANIFKYQKKGDTLILGEQSEKEIKKRKVKVEGRVVVAHPNILPKSWKVKIPGEHNRKNIACAILVCRTLGVPEKFIKRGVETFAGVPGRLEHIRTVGGIKYVNDTTATTPDGNRAAILALREKVRKNIVLIAGGNDKNLDYSGMAKLINQNVKALVLIKGTATDKILALLPPKHPYLLGVIGSMKEAVKIARQNAKRGDTILLSPGSASFGVFKNEFDRGDQFIHAVKLLV
ncbi:MAG: UDP-N-acetylmuramoyl-L-alanine--D-glutamate ligase [Candidatus Pacebacteria bacterium]|nr:UDP-N-acetylmuramoyl-L-alanine--D-glutamate ligase [Candidatus Paceibacterota bacterium]